VGSPTEQRTEFAYLLRWPDKQAAFMADQDREEIKQATRKHGGLVGAIEDHVLVPTDYSPAFV
jgi:hypothetical protein